jgi:hypothetical protein
VAQVLAQNTVIEKLLLPYIYTPDFLSTEPQLIEAWGAERPDQHKVALGLLGVIKPLYDGKVEPSVWEARQLLRLASCRKLDAASTGYEGFQPCPFLAGNPSTDAFSRELGLRIKVGTVTSAIYGNNKEITGIPPLLLNPKAVGFVERSLLAFLPEEENPEAWSVHYTIWRGLDAVRSFETGCKLPLLPDQFSATSPLIYDPGSPPEGYVERFKPAELLAFGLGYEEIVQLGFSPYIAAPLDKFLGDRPKLVEQYCDPEAGRKYLFRRIAGTLTGQITGPA